MNVLPFDQQLTVISALTEGCLIRSVAWRRRLALAANMARPTREPSTTRPPRFQRPSWSAAPALSILSSFRPLRREARSPASWARESA